MTSTDLDKIRALLNTTFEKELFDASLHNLNDKSNKLRFNNFAYSVRELSRHLLHSLSPDSEVLCCSWYKNETDKPNGISRGQRVKYAIQGGLEDAFVNIELIDISDINDRKKDIKDAIEVLNKHTHINSSTFNVPQKDIDVYSKQIMTALKMFAETIELSRKLIIDSLESKISDGFIEHSISECINEVDILATHHNLEEISPAGFRVSKIGGKTIQIEADGTVDVRLQWGSNSDLRKGDGLEINTSFPFTCIINTEVNKTFKESTILIDEFEVDTDDWYE